MDAIPALIAQVDSARLSALLHALTVDPLPCRALNVTLPGHHKSTLDEADDLIADYMTSWGYAVEREAVPVQAFRRDRSKPLAQQYSKPAPEDPWYKAHNVYGKRVGCRHPHELILALAHKDSQSWMGCVPAAYDNAVGTVALLEMAHILADYQPEHSLWFLFCNEEHTPWTSITAAQNAKQRGDKIVAVLNLDGIGAKPPEQTAAGKKTNVTVYTEPAGERLARLTGEVNERFAIGLEQRTAKRAARGDDDGSFVAAGYPAAVINIGSWPYGNPNYHAEGDIPERCDVPNAAKAVQAILAAVLVLDREEPSAHATDGERPSE